MSSLFHQIPLDIMKNCIMPLTYSPQSKELCTDIQSCYNVKQRLYKKYTEKFPRLPSTLHGESAEDWLSNDLGRFLNNDVPTIHGYQEFYINIYRRLFSLTSKNRDFIIDHLENMAMASMFSSDSHWNDIGVKYEINTIIGILTPSERIKLIEFMNSINFGEPI